MTNEEFNRLKAEALKRVTDMDKHSGRDRFADTIAAALECGIKCPNSGAQFDALVMIEDIWKNEEGPCLKKMISEQRKIIQN